MTLNAVIERTAALLAVTMIAGAVAWRANVGSGLAMVALFAGLALGMVNSFRAVASPPLIFAYAAVEGVFLGAISRWQEALHPGVVVQAVAGTGVTFAVMLALYRSGLVRVTPRFQKVLIGASLGYLVLMLGNLLLNMFHSGFNPWHGGVGLLTAGAGAVMASLYLTLDFDMVERGVRSGAPESEAWRAAFGLTVTLIWLYIELLRIISILRDCFTAPIRGAGRTTKAPALVDGGLRQFGALRGTSGARGAGRVRGRSPSRGRGPGRARRGASSPSRRSGGRRGRPRSRGTTLGNLGRSRRALARPGSDAFPRSGEGTWDRLSVGRWFHRGCRIPSCDTSLGPQTLWRYLPTQGRQRRSAGRVGCRYSWLPVPLVRINAVERAGAMGQVAVFPWATR
jgi:uncharacterized YccA/Bax inhibitor family protein